MYSSSNSFNVCPHCGKANALNARYCSSCGKQLSSPEDVIVCRRCHKPNPPMASFCGNCGASLVANEQTKICPKCNKEVPANDSVCNSCGYSFASAKYVQPDEPRAAAKPVKQKAAAVANPRNKGGRAFAIIGLVFLLLLAYFIMAPWRHEAVIKLDKGVMHYKEEIAVTDDDNNPVLDEDGMPKTETVIYGSYGIDMITDAIKVFTNKTGTFTDLSEKRVDPDGGLSHLEEQVYQVKSELIAKKIEDNPELAAESDLDVKGMSVLKGVYGVGGIMASCVIALLAVVMVIKLIITIIRIITGRRAKHANWLFLILAIIMLVWAIFAFVADRTIVKYEKACAEYNPLEDGASIPEISGFKAKIVKAFHPATSETHEILGIEITTWSTPYYFGFVIFAIPGYYLLGFLGSLIAKQKKLKEQAA